MVVMFNAKTGSNIIQEKMEIGHAELVPYQFRIWCSNQSGFDQAWWSELEHPYRCGSLDSDSNL
jgi:hypothetical protein